MNQAQSPIHSAAITAILLCFIVTIPSAYAAEDDTDGPNVKVIKDISYLGDDRNLLGHIVRSAAR